MILQFTIPLNSFPLTTLTSLLFIARTAGSLWAYFIFIESGIFHSIRTNVVESFIVSSRSFFFYFSMILRFPVDSLVPSL